MGGFLQTKLGTARLAPLKDTDVLVVPHKVEELASTIYLPGLYHDKFVTITSTATGDTLITYRKL